MSSSGAPPSLADQLAIACWKGDLPSAKATVANGASVNEAGIAPVWSSAVLPLRAAVYYDHHDVVVWLLSLGADPNGDRVMWCGAYCSTAAMLQLLIDAGGDVNRKSDRSLPLNAASEGNRTRTREDAVRVLLAQPSLDFTIKHAGHTPEECARYNGAPALANMITQEVSAGGSGLLVLVQGDERMAGWCWRRCG